MEDPKAGSFEFADQSLLSDTFPGRWVALPYIYNALKTLRWPGVHDKIWRDDQVKNIHYILGDKPWNNPKGSHTEESMEWWWNYNDDRIKEEKAKNIDDGF